MERVTKNICLLILIALALSSCGASSERYESKYYQELTGKHFPTKSERKLVASLGGTESVENSLAVETLEAMGRDAVPLLVYALDSENDWVRYRAAELLSKSGPDAYEALPALIHFITRCYQVDQEVPSIFRKVEEAILNVGDAALELVIAALKQCNYRIGESGELICVNNEFEGTILCDLVVKFEPDHRIVNTLIDVIEDESGNIFWYPVEALGRIGPDASTALPYLEELKDRFGSRGRDEMIDYAIANIEGVPSLIEFCRDREHSFHTCMDIITRLTANCDEEYLDDFIALLMELSNDSWIALQRVAFESLKTIGSEKQIAEVSLNLYLGGDFEMGPKGTAAIKAIGPKPVVLELLPSVLPDLPLDKQMKVVDLLIYFNEGIHAVPTLIEFSKSDNQSTCVDAIRKLGKIGSDAKDAVGQLCSIARDDERLAARRAAVIALGDIGPDPGALPILKAILLDENSNQQRNAAFALREYGSIAMPVIVEGLKDDNSSVREHAALALCDIETDATAAVPYLLKLLKDENDTTRANAARAFISIGLAAPEAIPALIDALVDDYCTTRLYATKALAQFGDDASGAIPILTDALMVRFNLLNIDSAMALHKLQPELIDVVLFLRVLLDDGDLPTQFKTLQILGEIGADAKAALPKLRELANENTRYIPRQAEKSITAIEAALPDVSDDPYAWLLNASIPELIQELDSDDRDTRAHAAYAVSFRGSEAADAIGKLIECLDDEDIWIRWIAAHALSKIGPTPETINALSNLTRDEQAFIRAKALSCLRVFGKEAAGTLLVLISLLNDENQDVSLHAVMAITSVAPDGEGVYEAMLHTVEIDYFPLRWESLKFLNKHELGPEAVDVIYPLLWNPKSVIRREAGIAFELIGKHAAHKVPELVELLDDDDLYYLAWDYLGDIGTSAVQALPYLEGILAEKPHSTGVKIAIARIKGMESIIELLDSDDIYLQRASINALRVYGPEALETVPTLINLLGPEDVNTQIASVDALGNIGPDAASALPELRRLASSHSLYVKDIDVYPVRCAAKEAIAKIEGTWDPFAADDSWRSWRSYD